MIEEFQLWVRQTGEWQMVGFYPTVKAAENMGVGYVDGHVTEGHASEYRIVKVKVVVVEHPIRSVEEYGIFTGLAASRRK